LVEGKKHTLMKIIAGTNPNTRMPPSFRLRVVLGCRARGAAHTPRPCVSLTPARHSCHAVAAAHGQLCQMNSHLARRRTHRLQAATTLVTRRYCITPRPGRAAGFVILREAKDPGSSELYLRSVCERGYRVARGYHRR